MGMAYVYCWNQGFNTEIYNVMNKPRGWFFIEHWFQLDLKRFMVGEPKVDTSARQMKNNGFLFTYSISKKCQKNMFCLLNNWLCYNKLPSFIELTLNFEEYTMVVFFVSVWTSMDTVPDGSTVCTDVWTDV